MPKMTQQIPVRTLFAVSQNTKVAICNYAKYQMVPSNFRQVFKHRKNENNHIQDIIFVNDKHRKNCECCAGHYLIVNHYSSI